MGLNEISPGLGSPTRRLVSNNKSGAKVSLSIAPGEELIVAGNVGAQLVAAGLVDVAEPGEVRATIEGDLEQIAHDAKLGELARLAPNDGAAVAKFAEAHIRGRLTEDDARKAEGLPAKPAKKAAKKK